MTEYLRSTYMNKTSQIVTEFRAAAAQFPDRTAIISGEQTLSYRELEQRAASAAVAIGEHVKGDVVAMLMPNSPAFATLFLGALWAGKSVAVLPTLAPPPLIKMMTATAGAETVIASEEFVPRLMEAQVPCWMWERKQDVDVQQVLLQPLKRDAAVLLYTSGTTGMPKTVMLSEKNILSNAEGCRLATGFNDRQTMLAILPMFHAYGLTVTMLLPLLTGATVVIPERFAPRQVLQLIEKHKISCLVAVPSQYRLLTMEQTSFDTNSLWLCIAGAERLPEHVAIDFENRFKKPIVQGYGATEIAPVVSLNMPETNRLGSVGRPLPNLKVTIRDEEDHVLGVREIGEVCVEGDSVMLGYHNDPTATARKIRNGVLHTGDKGYMEADGFLHLVGRADDLVKVSGEKVYPAEVESALETVAGVDEAAVIALPDEKHGARLLAFIQLQPGMTHNEASLRAACREFMEPFKVPRSFAIVEQLPRTLTGKTDKRTLAASATA
jgi:long-chain acyl-CoA synthetase